MVQHTHKNDGQPVQDVKNDAKLAKYRIADAGARDERQKGRHPQQDARQAVIPAPGFDPGIQRRHSDKQFDQAERQSQVIAE